MLERRASLVGATLIAPVDHNAVPRGAPDFAEIASRAQAGAPEVYFVAVNDSGFDWRAESRESDGDWLPGVRPEAISTEIDAVEAA